jgi:hypothetical protein
MNDSIAAAPQRDPEITMTLEEVEAAMVEMEQRFIRLYQRFCELSKTTEADKRKQYNPNRDLKISASRSNQWAHRAGCNADEARNRVIAATKESLGKNREEESILWKLLLRLRKQFPTSPISDAIPDSVMSYIDLLHSQYNLTEAEKKAIKKLKTKKKKTVITTSI